MARTLTMTRHSLHVKYEQEEVVAVSSDQNFPTNWYYFFLILA